MKFLYLLSSNLASFLPLICVFYFLLAVIIFDFRHHFNLHSQTMTFFIFLSSTIIIFLLTSVISIFFLSSSIFNGTETYLESPIEISHTIIAAVVVASESQQNLKKIFFSWNFILFVHFLKCGSTYFSSGSLNSRVLCMNKSQDYQQLIVFLGYSKYLLHGAKRN